MAEQRDEYELIDRLNRLAAVEYPDDADLLGLLLDWAPEENVRRRILVDNPAEVFGF